MAVTIKEISGWLNNQETKHTILENNDILFGFGDENNTYAVNIKVIEDGKLVQIYSNKLIGEERNILKIEKHKHLLLILSHMLNINYNEKFGTWEFDPSDGEIKFAVETVLEDSIMTEQQFERIINHVLNSSNGFEQIITIMETGEIPEDDSIDDMFKKLMASMLSDIKDHDGDIDATLRDLKSTLKDDKKDEDGI